MALGASSPVSSRKGELSQCADIHVHVERLQNAKDVADAVDDRTIGNLQRRLEEHAVARFECEARAIRRPRLPAPALSEAHGRRTLRCSTADDLRPGVRLLVIGQRVSCESSFEGASG